MRSAAFDAVRRMAQIHGDLSSRALSAGFAFEGQRFPLVNPQRGIFKPKQMRFLLSIKTVSPRSGARIWYDDQIQVHQQIYDGDELIEYSFMGKDPSSADNQWLKEATDNRTPIIYFLGVAPGLYQAIMPTYLVGWDPIALKVQLAFGMSGQADVGAPDSPRERRYALREVKQRLHQASFRDAVIEAYRGRCALSGLPEVRLLDAAHIIVDSDELLGQPVVSNGIPLSKIHHAAFDAHFIGIDPDFRIHVSDRLLVQNDGPMLEALKRLHKDKIHLPRRPQDYPDRDRLAIRFEAFKQTH